MTSNEHLFVEACKTNDLKKAKDEWATQQHRIYVQNTKAFEIACNHESKDTVMWLFTVLPSTVPRAAFGNLCASNKDKAKWLYGISKEVGKPIDLNAEMFNEICGSTTNDVTKWFLEFAENEDILIAITEETLNCACLIGDKELVEWLYNKAKKYGTPLNIHANGEKAFCSACECNNEAVAKWLIDTAKAENKPIDIRAAAGRIFHDSIAMDGGEIIPWLIKTAKEEGTPIAINQQMFYTACSLDSLVVELLLKTAKEEGSPLDIHADEEKAFRLACKCNNPDLVKLLFSTADEEGKSIDIHTCNNEGINSLIERDSSEIMYFLLLRP